MKNTAPCVLMMAGGTGGHIFPGLAVAQVLKEQGSSVYWLGTPNSMEARLVPSHDIELLTIDFAGVRGKGLWPWLSLPWHLIKAWKQARALMLTAQVKVVVGMGGYVTVPGALAAWSLGLPIILHEQNAVAGLSNRLLSFIATRVFSTFPRALKRAEWVGNPLRSDFYAQAMPFDRYQKRQGPLHLLVVGGSLGAQALNRMVPQALALLPVEQRPVVVHQSGMPHLPALLEAYEKAGVQAQCVSFIDDMAHCMSQADLIICRSGASTVTEISAIGVAALMVPFPHAVDNHQTKNAQFLVHQNAAWMVPETVWTAQWLADWIRGKNRESLSITAQKAYALKKLHAAAAVAKACQEVAQ